MTDRPTVHLLGTGGTVANITGEYKSSEDFETLNALLARAPAALTDGIDLEYSGVTTLGSSSLTSDVWFDLLAKVRELAKRASPPDGVVITHGSNTVEETAYFLELVTRVSFPIVLTAAQRRADELGSDGFRNVRDAIRVAADSAGSHRGTLFVANEEIHHARDVVKLAATRPDAWYSPNGGRIGDVGETVSFHHRVDRSSDPIPVSPDDRDEFPLTDVHVVTSVLGANGNDVDALVKAGASGLVVAGFPTGTPARTGQKARLLEAVEQGIPVAVCNRGLEGIKSVDDVFLSGGTLRPQKVRILLALGLLETDDISMLETLFERY